MNTSTVNNKRNLWKRKTFVRAYGPKSIPLTRPRSPYGRFTRDIRTVHYRSLSRQARAPLVAQPEEWMKYRYDCARAARALRMHQLLSTVVIIAE